MNKTIIIYCSKYGTTKQYAEWIAEALSADVLNAKSVKGKTLASYDTIIYGGKIFGGAISGISLILKNFELLKDKNLVVFTCGLADPKGADNIEKINEGIDRAFLPEMKQMVKFFHLRGGIDYSKLNILHKMMMAMPRKELLKKDYDSLRDEDKLFLASYGKKIDFTDKKTIEPILTYIQGL